MGQVTASWEGVVELYAVAALLDAYVHEKITHEDFTEAVCDGIERFGGQDVAVTTIWSTAGMTVEVTA